MIIYQFFPKYKKIPTTLTEIIEQINSKHDEFNSTNHEYRSDKVLQIIAADLENIGYQVERSKLDSDKIKIPVLFKENGEIEKHFEPDAYHEKHRVVIEIEAGRAYTNFQFLKDLFEACMMHDIDYLVIAVRKIYGKSKSKDYLKIKVFFETLFSSNRLELPLKGILLIGY